VPAVCRAILALASALVPRWRRAEWREEWEAEVAHASPARSTSRDVARIAVRCLGAFPHAAHLRVADWSVEMIVQDVRQAVRGLLRRPLFTVVAIVTLALGIGANAAIFAVISGVLLRPLPYEDAERLVWISGAFSGGTSASVSPPDFHDYRAENRAFSSMAASQFGRAWTWTGGERPEDLETANVTSNYLSTLGLQPVIGRTFAPEEERVADPEVIMISEALWRTRFGASPSVLGRALVLDGTPRTVIGVFPSALSLPADRDVLAPIPFAAAGYDIRAAHFLRPIARLAEGVTLEQAQRDVDVIARRLEEAYPASNQTWRLGLVPLHERLVGGARAPLLLLLGAVGVVVLIACVNVANLVLARASARAGEFAVRAALGASRLRLARQLLTEAVLLSVVAGAAAAGVAAAGVGALRAFGPADIPRLAEVRVDGAVFGYTFALAVIVGFAFGLAPVLRLDRAPLTDALRRTGRGGDGGGQRLRAGLVVSEVALSSLLVVGAALLIRSFDSLRGVDPGFDATRVLVAQVRYPDARYPAGQAAQMHWRIEDRLRAIPGVVAVGATNAIPIAEYAGDTRAHPASRPPANNAWVGAQIRAVTPDYFNAMSIPLVRGRTFVRTDSDPAAPVVILNERMAEEFFPSEDPVGQILMVGIDTQVPMRVVGVVGSVRQFGLAIEPNPEFYLHHAQAEGAGRRMTLVIRTAADPAPLATAVADAIRELDPDQPVSVLRPLDDILADSIARPRFQMLVLGTFATLALVLAAIGVYGVLAYAVAQRQREIGIRIALGARRSAVVAMVVARGMALAGAGLVLGLLAAAALTRLLRSALFGIDALDPAAFAVAPAVLITAALVASWIPARRAARVDPITTLRE
jgi:putative ABC transport system permease protein